MKELKAFSLPPVPEEVESWDYLKRLSDSRSDDLVCGGTVPTSDLPEMMQMAGDAVQEYERLWRESQPEQAQPAIIDAPGTASQEATTDQSFNVNEVLYGLMNDNDRLQELAKLVGKLRFAIDGRDSSLQEETCEEITAVARHMPPDYQVDRLLSSMLEPHPANAAILTQLYLDRCYRLLEGDQSGVQELEERIRSLEAGS